MMCEHTLVHIVEFLTPFAEKTKPDEWESPEQICIPHCMDTPVIWAERLTDFMPSLPGDRGIHKHAFICH